MKNIEDRKLILKKYLNQKLEYSDKPMIYLDFYYILIQAIYDAQWHEFVKIDNSTFEYVIYQPIKDFISNLYPIVRTNDNEWCYVRLIDKEVDGIKSVERKYYIDLALNLSA